MNLSSAQALEFWGSDSPVLFAIQQLSRSEANRKISLGIL